MNSLGPKISGTLNGRILNVVIDFDFIVNSDVGLIRFIKENYLDDRIFLVDLLRNMSDGELLSLLYSRKNWNPLSVISTESNLSDIDDLYNSFFKNFKKEIIEKSISLPKTLDFIKLIENYGQNFGISPSFMVEDILECDKLQTVFPKIPVINKMDTKLLLEKNPYYVKDYRFFLRDSLKDKVKYKKIYLPSYQYSIDYIENTQCTLTTENIFVYTGDDYRIKES